MKQFTLWICSWIAFSNAFLFHRKENYGINEILKRTLKFHVATQESSDDIKHEIFTQKHNHFNPTDLTVWQQRYWRYDKNYDKESRAPVFLMIGGESAADPRDLQYTSMRAHVVKYKAAAFLIEHRFYGDSQPSGSLQTEDMENLNSEQALADIAHFIDAMNKKHNFPMGTKWIVFGGSYAGTLAAWMRIKYPHLVYAAYASSAPLFAKADFHEYYQVVTNSIASYKKKCVSAISTATKKLDKLVQTEKGKKEVKKTLKLCEDLKDENDISVLFTIFAEEFAYVTQYYHPTYFPRLENLCDIMLNSKDPIMKRYAKVLSANRNPEQCVDVSYKNLIKCLQEEDKMMKAWLYQTCTEFGWYQTSSKRTDPFGRRFPLRLFTKLCQDIYGSKFDGNLLKNAVERTNILFGGMNVTVSRILFIHGSVDPWHPLGNFKSTSKDSFDAIYIPGASHCADFTSATKNDSSEMQKARKKIDQIIESWLS